MFNCKAVVCGIKYAKGEKFKRYKNSILNNHHFRLSFFVMMYTLNKYNIEFNLNSHLSM